jgi:uncharacterized protein (DUF1697 family)
MTASVRVALLRGINVGRAKRIAMADLRDLVESLGYERVSTALNSGNVIFSLGPKSKGDPAFRIERGIMTKLGVSARVTILTVAELDQMMRENPLAAIATDLSRLLAVVPATPKDFEKLALLKTENWAPERFALGEGMAYIWCPEGILESRLASVILGRIFRDCVTTRNWATMTRLHELAHSQA